MPKLPSVDEIIENVKEKKGISDEEWDATFKRFKHKFEGLVTDPAVAVMVAQYYGVNYQGYAITSTKVEIRDIDDITEARPYDYVNMRIWLYSGEKKITKRGNSYWGYVGMDSKGNIFRMGIYEKEGKEITKYPDGTCLYLEKGKVQIYSSGPWLNIDLSKYSTIHKIEKEPPAIQKATTEALVNEARNFDKKLVEVEGIVLPGSVRYNQEKGSLGFDLFDGTEYYVKVTFFPSVFSEIIKSGKMSVDFEDNGLDSCKVKVVGGYIAKNTWTGREGNVITQEHVLRGWDMNILQQFEVEEIATTLTDEVKVPQKEPESIPEVSEPITEITDDVLCSNITEIFSIAESWSKNDVKVFLQDIYGDKATEALETAISLNIVVVDGDKIRLAPKDEPTEKDKSIKEKEPEEVKQAIQPQSEPIGNEGNKSNGSQSLEITDSDKLVQKILFKVKEYKALFTDGIKLEELVREIKAPEDEIKKRVEWLKEEDKLYEQDGKIKGLA